MQTQDYQKLQTRKMKGLKRKSEGKRETPAKKSKEADAESS
jgi:hypothetical protein